MTQKRHRQNTNNKMYEELIKRKRIRELKEKYYDKLRYRTRRIIDTSGTEEIVLSELRYSIHELGETFKHIGIIDETHFEIIISTSRFIDVCLSLQTEEYKQNVIQYIKELLPIIGFPRVKTVEFLPRDDDTIRLSVCVEMKKQEDYWMTSDNGLTLHIINS